ncbi:hypothetical protein GobsT_28970 [Gemmata obscuriglobus]|uniref:Uncharacterized protein n=1 Tax=Gemmata obscuriglobus TaxID=114 RepID=A0A2Z3HB75_9BACT|nr:hypothetical protein [Gemmata obscuriglobus]AWM38874.1 hypothetical protein C1280_19055 [Gemmata obscuriglobus]QEG28123.1 hypothetical protein GobsT_28970 [Gemmata obscuriglobus]VTS05779.1 unnamed protein product [Gemmata obscuriglobus UQM 2246]
MTPHQKPGPDVWDYTGLVAVGRATNRPLTPPTEEEVRRLEQAWNDPARYRRRDVVWAGGAAARADARADAGLTLVPSRQDIAALPRWARVAFAARCARRVLPVIKKLWTDSPKPLLPSLDKAVRVAETAAADRNVGGGSVATTHVARADGAADAVAAVCAADSARAAAYAADAAHADVVRGAVTAAVTCLLRASTVGNVGHLAAPARDFDALARRAKSERWTHDTPVPPSTFGPMWDGTPPEWWTDDLFRS